MRDKRLIEEVQEKAWENRGGIFVPRTEGDVRTNWPVCQTCLRDVEAVEMKNYNSFGVELWARCHGKEDYYKVSYPYRLENDDQIDYQILVAMRSFRPFVRGVA